MAKKKKPGSDRQLSFDFGSTKSSSSAPTVSKPVRAKSTSKPKPKKNPSPRSSHQITDEVIRASAGTGKTFRLSNRYIELMAGGVDPKNILATTFTRKAAGEILDRIAGRLTEASLSQKAAKELNAFIHHDFSTQDYQQLLKKLTASLNSLQIGTLDSFFSQIARNFCFELDLPHNWTIIDNQDEIRLINRAISQTLAEENILNLIRLMSKDDAGRGVGQEIRSIVKVLSPIFYRTELSAWQMELPSGKHFELDLEPLLKQIQLIDPEGKPKGLRVALEKAANSLSGGDWDGFYSSTIIKNCMQGSFKYGRSELPEPIANEISQLLPQIKKKFYKSIHDRNTNTYQFLEQFDNNYRPLKSTQGDLTFSNVQDRLAGWIDSLPNPSSKLIGRLDFHIQHLLLDEFQDTVPNQWKILLPVANRILQESGGEQKGSLFCVGDQKQAIYRWRGGDSRIFGSVEQAFPNVNSLSMSKSYRSSNVVLNCVNRVFKHLSAHESADSWGGVVQRWKEIFEDHHSSENNQDLSGYCELREIETDDADDVIQEVARIIQLQLQTRPGFSIGVLVPKNDDVAKVIAELSSCGISASEEVGVRISDSTCVSILVSLLQLLDYPNDSASFFHVITSDPKSKILDCFSKKEKSDYLDGKLDTESLITGRKFLSWVDRQRESLIRDGYGPVVSRWAEVLKKVGNSRDRKKLDHAVEEAFNYDLPLPLRPSEFGRYLDECKRQDPTSDPVRVMNIHQSKGLEFDTVIFTKIDGPLTFGALAEVVDYQPDLNQSPTIVSRYINKEAQLALPKDFRQMFDNLKREVYHEQLCKLYVAMTRARRSLLMISKKPKSKKQASSMAGILKATLWDPDQFPEDSGGLLYQSGDPCWGLDEIDQSKSSPDSDMKGSRKSKSAKKSQIQLAPNPNGFQRGMPRTSPSSLEGETEFSLLSLLGTKERSSALLKGEIIHGWFELVDWLDDPIPTEDQLHQQALTIETESEKWKSWIPEFRSLTEKAEVKRVLSKAFYQQPQGEDWNKSSGSLKESQVDRLVVQNERPFAITTDSGMLHGFIDRLVFCFSGDKLVHVEILDYKTDKISLDDQEFSLQKKVDHYRPQLEAYRQAMVQLAGLPEQQVTARLLFLSIDRSVQVC